MDGLTNATGTLNGPDFPTPGTTVPPIVSATLPTSGTMGDTADVPLTFDVTSFLSGQLVSGADFAGILVRVGTLGDVIDLGSTGSPYIGHPPSLAVTYTAPVPAPAGLILCGEACLAGQGFARARRRGGVR